MLLPQIFNRNQFFSGLFVFIFGIFFIATPSSVSALTIISPIVELSGEAGSNLRGVVKVFNESNEAVTLVSSVESFTLNEQGQSVYTNDGFTEWFRLEQPSITLQPRQVLIVPFDVLIPRFTTPGGYYATIFWQTDNQGTSPVTVNAKVGTVVLLTVEGNLRREVSIDSFAMEPARSIVWGGPVQFQAQLSNTGNIHSTVQGKIMIQSWGREATVAVQGGSAVVLPGAVRQFNVMWLGDMTGTIRHWFTGAWQEAQAGIFGPTNATLLIDDGAGRTVEKTLSFWFIPVHLLVIILVAIFLIILFVFINRRMNRLKRRMMQAHEHSS